MNNETKNFYVTSPIYYVNDKPHIGSAYTTLACDVIARYKRLGGYNVKFLTGTDEHGQKVDKAAKAANLTPKEFTDKVSKHFHDLTEVLNISNDDFIRTTEERHIKAAQAIWKKLVDNNQIYLDSYKGWYSVRDEAFYNKDEIIDGLAPTGAPVEWVEEESYFFKLSHWGDKLLEFYHNNPDFIKPLSRRNEVLSFVKAGLHDLSISRTSFDWGVPVEGNRLFGKLGSEEKFKEDLARRTGVYSDVHEDSSTKSTPKLPLELEFSKKSNKHVMYVWLDALTNYLSALDYPDTNSQNFKQFWPADFHIVGKDILRFHAIYWPAFLMAADLSPPKCVYAHGWWTNEGQKISKSLGNTIDPVELINEFGLDQTRYFLMREISFGSDGNYSRSSMINRINAELSNNIGNLVQRTMTMVYKSNQSIPNITDNIEQLYLQNELLNSLEAKIEKYENHMENLEFNLALELVMSIASDANVFIDQKAPWNLAKTDINQMNQVLFILAETIRNIAILLLSFIPTSANLILDQLNIEKDQRTLKNLHLDYALQPEQKINSPKAIFPRFANAS